MDPNLITPQQATASLANIAPFLWPFVLLSLGVALTPVSPISWSYSTWLLFAIPLIITVFAPIRAFSGPLRFAYFEYASKIGSLAVSLLKAVVVNYHSIPTLALPALFFLPVLPILFFVVFPALPVIWHYIAYHYRRRLKAITTSVDNTNANLELAIARARQAVALAHTYEKQVLCNVSTTRNTSLVALPCHSTDFGTPVFNPLEGRSRLVPTPGTLGADLAGKVLDTEKQMATIEDASERIRVLSVEAVAVATEGHMVAGEESAEKAAQVLQSVIKQLHELSSTADQVRCLWVEFRRRLKTVVTSVDNTNANLDLAIARARQAVALAHTYEKQALYTVSTTQTTPLLALPWHSTDFGAYDDSEGPSRLVPSSGTLGDDLVTKLLEAEKQMATIEEASQKVRALSAQAVAVATEGDMVVGEELAENAANLLKGVVEQVDELQSTAEQVRSTWVELRDRLKDVTTSVDNTNANLDVAIARARRAVDLAHTFEKQSLCTISTTRTAPLLALPCHTTDFGTPESDESEGPFRLVPSSGTLGAKLVGKLLEAEKQMAEIEEASQKVRSLSAQAVAVSTGGDMDMGEELSQNAANLLESVVTQVDELHSTADQVRSTWVEFRHRLKSVTTSIDNTNANLDLATARAREAVALAHTYEKQALYTVSTAQTTPLLALPWYSTDFGTPEPNNSGGHSGLIPTPGTLGAELVGKVLDAEKQMAAIEETSQRVRSLSAQAMELATAGDMDTGDDFAENAANLLERIVKQVDELHSTADKARCAWVDFRRRLKAVVTSVDNTNANLDLAIARARQSVVIAHTYEEQALCTISTTQTTPSLALPWHSTDFGTPGSNNAGGYSRLVSTPGTMGADLVGKVLETEKQMTTIEEASQKVRSLSAQAVAVATEGNLLEGDKLAERAARLSGEVAKRVDELHSTVEQARCTWVEFRRRLKKITTSASTTTASLDLAITKARRAATLSHTYEEQALAFVSTTRRTASQTLALHNANFFESTQAIQRVRQMTSSEAERVRAVGRDLAKAALAVETRIGDIEHQATEVRATLERAIMDTVNGDVMAGESLTANAADSLRAVVDNVQRLCSTSDDVRKAWVELSVEYWAIP